MYLVLALAPPSPYHLTACKQPKTSPFLRPSAEQVEGCFYISKWNQQRQIKTVACHLIDGGGILLPRRISRNMCKRFAVKPPINKSSTEDRCQKRRDELCIRWMYPFPPNEAEEAVNYHLRSYDLPLLLWRLRLVPFNQRSSTKGHA